MTDPYNSAPPRKDPWREVPVKKDRRERKSNPRRRRLSAKMDRCVADVKAKGGAVNPYAVCRSRVKNPRRRRGVRGLVDRAGAGLRKRLGVSSHRIRHFGGNPRKLSRAAQRRQAKSLLDWSATVLRKPNMAFPGGRMSHDVARDQIAVVRQKYATNPRRAYYLLEAHRGKDRLYYAGRSKFGERSKAKLLASREDARALAVELHAGFPKALKGWALRVVVA